jgi:hypothetical protein
MPELPTLKPLTATTIRPPATKLKAYTANAAPPQWHPWRTPPHIKGVYGGHARVGVRWCTVVYGGCTGGARPSPMASSAPRARYTAPRTSWCQQAEALGWTERELFGLHPVPERPAANYSRLSRLDGVGLIWLLHGRPVIALTQTAATILASSGARLTYQQDRRDGANYMSGARSSNKGARTGRAMVRLLLGHGLPARKVSAMYKRGEDLRVVVGDVERSVEVKCLAADWLDGRDLLIVKADRQEPLVVLRMSLAAQIARARVAGGQ